jgi:hypothetical protein
MEFRIPRPSGAMLVAVLALVVAMSGTAYAITAASGDSLIQKRTLSGNRLRVNTVTGSEIKERSLAAVPRANDLPSLTWHKLRLLNGWQNYNGGVRRPAWAVDAQGVVHFRGAIDQSPAGSLQFARLPVGIRPAAFIFMATNMFASATGRIYVATNGYVYADPTGPDSDAQNFTSLDGITYWP